MQPSKNRYGYVPLAILKALYCLRNDSHHFSALSIAFQCPVTNHLNLLEVSVDELLNSTSRGYCFIRGHNKPEDDFICEG